MAKVKSALEKALEKMDAIGSASAEEKEALRESEQLRTLLAEFYKGKLGKDGLWEKMREFRPALLKEAQLSMINTLRLGGQEEEFLARLEGIIAIESLKQSPNVPGMEDLLNSMQKIQQEYREIREGAVAELRAAIEKNPQMRVRPMKSPDGRVYQAAISVEEALQAKLAEFLPEHERRYEALFARTAEELRAELR